jgi:dihydrolipoamide dehydrogenase
VTLVEPADHLLPSEPTAIGEVVADALARDGVDVRTGHAPQRVDRDGDRVVVHLEGDDPVRAGRILVATGKTPRVAGLGLETIDVRPDPDSGGLAIDDRCRVAERVWAVGDVTAVAPFTHTANYQAKVVVANICGESRTADYRAIPRVVYTDPAVFCVGRTDDDLRTASYRLEETARATVEERRDGSVTLYADGKRLVGAACVGPGADHWGAELTLAVRAEVDLTVLREVVHAFPTFGEALEPVYAELCEGSPDEGKR